MALRKDTMKKQFAEALPAFLEPGEQVVAGAYTVSGPTPFLAGLVGIVGMLFMGMRYYFMAVTDRRVVFLKASMMTVRPKGLAWADPRSAVAISDVNATASVWGHLRYTRADGKTIRLNFQRFWRDEMQQVVAALGVQTAPPTA